MTLYEITGELLALLEMAENPDTDPETLRDTMEAVSGELEEKAEGYGCVIRQLEYDAAALATEIKRLTNRKRAIEENVQAMKSRLQDAMTATGKTKLKTSLFSFAVRKNAPALTVTDEDKIPERYWVLPEPVLDKTALKDDLKAGQEIPGATLTQGESLQIR